MFFEEVNHDSQSILYAKTIYFKINNRSLCKGLIDDSLGFCWIKLDTADCFAWSGKGAFQVLPLKLQR